MCNLCIYFRSCFAYCISRSPCRSGYLMSISEYPKLVSVNCAICGAEITLIIELIIGTPEPIDGLMRLPLDPEPTVLSGCHHFYDAEAENV